WIADFNDAINFLEIFETVGGNNYTNWENDEFKALLKDSRAELDSDKRQEILKEAEELFMEELPIVLVYSYKTTKVAKENVKGIKKLFMEELPIVPVYFYTNTYAAKDNVKGIEALPVGAFNLKWGYKAE